MSPDSQPTHPTPAGRNPIATNVRSLIQRFETSSPPKGAESSSTTHKPADTSAAYGRLEPSVGYSAVQASRPAPVDDASSSTGSVLSYSVALIGSLTCDIIPTSMGEAPWCTQAKAPDRLGPGPLSSTADSSWGNHAIHHPLIPGPTRRDLCHRNVRVERLGTRLNEKLPTLLRRRINKA